jgi:phage terminase Nu1 subunit (DNA packaging protein)
VTDRALILLTPAQLAAHMSVSARTVARWDAEGCPCEWAGKRRRYDPEAVRAWNREKATACPSDKTPKAAGTPKPASIVGDFTAACRRVQVRVMPSASSQS